MEDFSNEAYYLFFSALASRTRLAIIDILRTGPKTVTETSVALKQEQRITRHNLEQLEHSFITLSTGRGKEKRYSLNLEIVQPLSKLLAFHVNKYCPGLKECILPEKLNEYMKEEAAKNAYIEHDFE